MTDAELDRLARMGADITEFDRDLEARINSATLACWYAQSPGQQRRARDELDQLLLQRSEAVRAGVRLLAASKGVP